jgi:hypothetical protein
MVVPEMVETGMRVSVVGEADGGIKATKPCVLCGLKRDERVEKVDGVVEDSFGEWWSEHWGHVACRNFWREHRGELAKQ